MSTPFSAGAVIGCSLPDGKPFSVHARGLINGLYIRGLNGQGKSILIEHLAVADMYAGRGLIVFDPHGSLVDRLLTLLPAEREQDLVLLDAGADPPTFTINPFYCPNPRDPKLLDAQAEQVMEMFKKAFPAWGAYLNNYVPMLAYLLLANSPRCTMLDIPRVLTDGDFRAQLVQNVENPVVHDFWAREYRTGRNGEPPPEADSTGRRVRTFIMNRTMQQILGSRYPSVNFDRYMAEKKIVLVKLPSEIGEDKVNLLGTALVAQVFNAAFARLKEDGHPDQIMLYADEFQRFATRDFARLLDEARKTGITTVIAHQRLAQLEDPYVRAATNAALNKIYFAQVDDDAGEAVGYLDTTPPKGCQVPVQNAFDILRSASGYPVPEVAAAARAVKRVMAEYLSKAQDFSQTMGFEREEPRWVKDGRYQRLLPPIDYSGLQKIYREGIAEAEEELRQALNLALYEEMLVALTGERSPGETPQSVLKPLVEAVTGFAFATQLDYLAKKDADPEHKRAWALLNPCRALIAVLQKHPMIDKRGDTTPTVAQMKVKLRGELVQLPRFEAYTRLLVDGKPTYHHLRIALPETKGPDRGKVARLTPPGPPTPPATAAAPLVEPEAPAPMLMGGDLVDNRPLPTRPRLYS